jgi:hypothetical protein
MFESKIEKQSYLLEKMYDKYQMEISRKDRLESKAIGYYTIIGISFAAFLVVEPLLFERGFLLKFSFKEILSIINFLFCLCYLFVFIFLVIRLHNSYKPKKRPEFDPIDAYQKLLEQNEGDFVTPIKDKLESIISEYETKNKKVAETLGIVNHLCIANMLLVVAIFAILFLSYIF